VNDACRPLEFEVVAWLVPSREIPPHTSLSPPPQPQSSLATIPGPFPISFQAHSFNDLRQWPSLLLKGAQWIKIDPQWAPQSFCASQPRAPPGDPRGCLLLNHDSPLSPSRPGGYNTTQDLLAFLTAPDNRPWFSPPSANSSSPIFHISLCFKGCGTPSACPCDASPDTLNWLSLVDDLVADANAAVAAHNLSVEFVLDGAGNPGASACLANRWRPWSSVYISGDDPDGAFYSSANASFGWDRLLTLNEDTDHWPFAVLEKYGKFLAGDRPFLVWEPSDEDGILLNAGLFVAAGLSHPPGMRFAINIEPAQFETYAGNLTGRAWDVVVAPPPSSSSAAAAPAGSELAAFALAPAPPGFATASTSPRVGALFFSSQDTGGLSFSLLGLNTTGSPVVQFGAGALPSLPPLPVSGAVSGASTTFANGTVALLLSTTTSTAFSITPLALVPTADGTALTLLPSPPGSPSPLPASTLLSATAPFACASPAGQPPSSLDDICVALAYTQDATTDPSCLLRLQTFRGTGSPSLPTALCLADRTPALPSIASLRVSASTFVRGGSIDLWAGVAVVYAGDVNGSTAAEESWVFGASACVDLTAGSATANDASCGSSSSALSSAHPSTTASFPPLSLWPGASPSLSLVALPPTPPLNAGSLAVFTAHGAGYCANSEAHNKAADVGLCDQPPVANSGGAYLNFYHATLAGWTSALLAAQSEGRGWVGPCSVNAASGMFGMGLGPMPSLFLEEDAPGGDGGVRVGAAVAYTAATDGTAPSKDPLSCGAASGVPGGGIKLAGWPLAQGYFS
jgi:hypothetical protein